MVAKTWRAHASVALDQARDEAMGYFAAQTDQPSTLSRLRRVFRKLARLGIRTLEEIDDDAARRYERSIPRRVVGDSRLNLMRDFRTVCNALREPLGLIDREPRYPLLRGKAGARGRPVATRRSDIIRIFAVHRPRRDDPWEKWRRYAFFAVAVYTGMLRDDIRDLLVDDVHLDNGEISIRRRKGNKRSDAAQRLAMHPDLRRILADWIPQTGGTWVFPGKRKIGSWKGSGCKKLRASEEIRLMGREAGVETVVNCKTVRLFHFEAIGSIEGLGSLLGGTAPRKQKGRSCVDLKGESEQVFVRGESRGVLSSSQYELISVLDQKFPTPLSMKDLTRLTGSETWRKAWRQLRQDPDWKRDLIKRGELFEGKPSRGFVLNRY